MPKQDYYEMGQLTDLAYLVLATLTRPRYGYSIMSSIHAITDGEVSIGPASLYTTLRKLTEAGFIRLLDDSDKKKIYGITSKGLEALLIEIEKRKRLADFGIKALAEYQEVGNE